MRVQNIQNQTFGAKYICRPNALRFDSHIAQYIPIQVNFVKIDYTNKRDIDAIRKAGEKWRTKYGEQISRSAKHEGKSKYHFRTLYAITRQNDDFSNLDSNKILGLAETREEMHNKLHLSYLQVKPQNYEYNHIGSAILDALKSLYQEIELVALNGTENFYILNDFKLKNEETSLYSWIRGKMK